MTQLSMFGKPKTMRQRVLAFCKEKGYVTSGMLDDFHDEIKLREGKVKGLLRIRREAQQLAADGLLKRLDDDEKLFRGFDKRFAVYQFVKGWKFK